MTVVDASTALKAVFTEDYTAEALDILEEPQLIAPAFIDVEAASAISRRVSRSEVRVDEAPSLLTAFRLLPIRRRELDAEVTDEAFALAIRLSHSLYDCLYLALAIRSDSGLVTADDRFARAAVRGGFERLRFVGRAQP